MRISAQTPQYLRHLKTLGRSEYTIRQAKYDLRSFVKYLAEECVYDVEQLTGAVLEEYQQDLAFRFTTKGSPLSRRTQSKTLSMVRGFTRFLKQKDYLVSDPGERLKLPKTPRTLPKLILTSDEIKCLMDAPDKRTEQGFRNRVMLEIFYDTAIRRLELSNIRITDLDLEAGYIRINGKGDKERVVPMSQRVCDLVRSYVISIRPSFLHGNDPGYLILNRWGRKMDPAGIWAVIKRCACLAGIRKNVTPHTFRHTCATHMLRNGAPIRHIQEMLGHESLTSTQVYTRVTINELKAIHAKYHPGEKMNDKQ